MDWRPTFTTSSQAQPQWTSTTTPAGIFTSSGQVTQESVPSRMPSPQSDFPPPNRSLDSYLLDSASASPMLSSSREGGLQYSTQLQSHIPESLVSGYQRVKPGSSSSSPGLQVLPGKRSQGAEAASKKARVEENDQDTKFNGYYGLLPFQLRRGVDKRTIWRSLPLGLKGFVRSIGKADAYEKLNYSEREDASKTLMKLKTVYKNSIRTGVLPSFVMREKTASQDSGSEQSGASGGLEKPKESKADVKNRVKHLLSNLYPNQKPVLVRSSHSSPSTTVQNTGVTGRYQPELSISSPRDSGYSASFSVPHYSPVEAPLSQKTYSYGSAQPVPSPVIFPMSAPACVPPASPVTPQLPHTPIPPQFTPATDTAYGQPFTPLLNPGLEELEAIFSLEMLLPPSIGSVSQEEPKSDTPAQTEPTPLPPRRSKPRRPIPAFGNRPYSDDSSDEEDVSSVKPLQRAEPQPLAVSGSGSFQEATKKKGDDRENIKISFPRYKLAEGRGGLPQYQQRVMEFPGLPNASKKLSYINSAIHCLKTTLSREDKHTLISQWRESRKDHPENVVEGYAQLLDQMESQPLKKHGINIAWKELVQLCRKDERFQPVIQTEIEASARGLFTVEDPPDGVDIFTLTRNDSYIFLRTLSGVLSEHLNSPPVFRQQTSLLAKSGQDTFVCPLNFEASGSGLVIPLHESGILQKSIDQFFELDNSRNKDFSQWSAGVYKTTRGISKNFKGGWFPVVMKTQLITDLPDLHDFHLCISGASAHSVAGEVYKTLLNDSFCPINITVLNKNEPGKQHEVRAAPVCIIAFTGEVPTKGRYLCLVKQQQEWVIIEDGFDPVATSQPERQLLQNKMVPYVIYYQVVDKQEVVD